MKKGWRYLAGSAVAGMLGLWLAAAPAEAIVVLTGCAGGDFGDDCSMAELLAGGSIRVDDKLFDNWRDYAAQFTGDGFPVDADTIRVLPIGEGTRDGIGIRYQSAFFFILGANETSSQDTTWTYDVSNIFGNATIVDNVMRIEAGSADVGDGLLAAIQIAETVVDVNNDPLADKLVFIVDPGADQIEVQRFFEPVNFLTVTKDIGLVVICDNGDCGAAFISDFEQSFSQIPGPATLVLLGAGLLGLGAAARRKGR
jgi:hypothetical protein